MTNEDRLNKLDAKIQNLEAENKGLQQMLIGITEALMILIERKEDMTKPDTMGPGFMANN